MKTTTKCLCLAAIVGALPCLLFAWALWRPSGWVVVRSDTKVPADFIVVLGGDESRARYAARCFQEGVAPRVLVSGCGDASVNRDLLVALGVPQTAISMEPRSHSTLENARYAAPLPRKAGARKVAIVTSWYHSSRAYATFCHEAPDLTFISLPVASQVDKAPYEQSCQRWELLKKVWYLVRYGVPL